MIPRRYRLTLGSKLTESARKINQYITYANSLRNDKPAELKVRLKYQRCAIIEITFNSDGTIDDVKKNISNHTVFNSDGSITETFTDSNSNVTVVDTTFNTDGSITKKIRA